MTNNEDQQENQDSLSLEEALKFWENFRKRPSTIPKDKSGFVKHVSKPVDEKNQENGDPILSKESNLDLPSNKPLTKEEKREVKFNKLWDEFISITSEEERRITIFKDIQKSHPKFKILAEDSPWEFFIELGGNEYDIQPTHNWAIEYTYEDWVDEFGEEEEEIDEEEKKRREEDEDWEDDYERKKTSRELEWDLQAESIQHAYDTGFWRQTCLFILEGPDDVSLPFIFGCTEGEFDGSVLENPYTTKDGEVSFGIPFY